jgi:hypothetical protein
VVLLLADIGPNFVHLNALAGQIAHLFVHDPLTAFANLDHEAHQRDHANDALAKNLEQYIAKELQPYIPTFGSDYYQQMFRLRGLDYPTEHVKRPQYFGILTNEIVYRRLAPGVLDELSGVTPRLGSGWLSHKLFLRLTKTRGYPKLKEHLGAVVTMMQLSDDWHDFMKKLDRLRPRLELPKGKPSPQLAFDYDAVADSGKGI